MRVVSDSAGGATEFSPARKRWVLRREKPQPRRGDRSLTRWDTCFRASGAAGLVLLLLVSVQAAQDRSVDAPFQKFWAAASPAEAEKIASEIVKSGITFDEALRRLKAGRTYGAQPSGVQMLKNKTKDGVEHFYAVNVPANYDA